MAVYELAYALRTPVSTIHEMSHEEYSGWMAYFERRPPGWREDDRTYKLMSAWGAKAKPNAVFPSLEPIYNPKVELNAKGQNMASLRNSQIFRKLLTAKGGDKVFNG